MRGFLNASSLVEWLRDLFGTTSSSRTQHSFPAGSSDHESLSAWPPRGVSEAGSDETAAASRLIDMTVRECAIVAGENDECTITLRCITVNTNSPRCGENVHASGVWRETFSGCIRVRIECDNKNSAMSR